MLRYKVISMLGIAAIIIVGPVSTKVNKNQVNFYNVTACPRFHTQNINGGEILPDGSYQYEGKVYPPGHFGHFDYYLDENATEIETDRHIRGCICTHSERKCARVCCTPVKEEDGTENIPEICPQEFNFTLFDEETETKFSLHQHHQLIYHNLECLREKMKVYFDFDKNGSIYVSDLSGAKSYLDYDQNCLLIDEQELFVVRCSESLPTFSRFRMLGIGMLLSVPFFLATFIVYAVIPELRNLHGLSLMSYVGGLTVAYTFLATVQIKSTRDECYYGLELCYDPTFCTISAYIIYFSFMLSFFWLNTMCFDIFWTFRGVRGNSSAKKNFMYYCIYAWGMATFLTVLVLSLDMSDISEDYKSGMYFTQQCFLKHSKIVEFLYLYMILLILVCTNITFFGVTAYRIRKVQPETAATVGADTSSHQHSRHNYDKNRFMLYFRLFIIMGVTWSMELISWFIDTNSPWFYVTDLINCLQGVSIFICVICNEKVRKLLVKRYRKLRGTSATSKSVENVTTDVSHSF